MMCKMSKILNISITSKNSNTRNGLTAHLHAWCSRCVARIQLVVDDEIAELLDEGVAMLSLQTRKRQTRTSFIILAIRAELERLKQNVAPRS